MKVLVTGSRGQVGSALCRLGAHTSFTIIGLGSRDLDIGDEAAVIATVEQLAPDIIINAAAYTAVDKAEQEPSLAERVNARGPAYLAAAAGRTGTPLVHFSTDYVFSGNKQEAYVETDTVAPLGVYGLSKLMGEQAIQSVHDKHLIFRTSWVFGLEGHNFPKTILRLAGERPEIRVVGDQYGCPTYADDIARAIWGILEGYRAARTLPWGLYHYAGQSPCSWYEMATGIVDAAFEAGLIGSKPSVKKISTAEYSTPARRPANSRLDCQKVMGAFPGTYLSDWPTGIRNLINNTKKNN